MKWIGDSLTHPCFLVESDRRGEERHFFIQENNRAKRLNQHPKPNTSCHTPAQRTPFSPPCHPLSLSHTCPDQGSIVQLILTIKKDTIIMMMSKGCCHLRYTVGSG